MSRGAGTDPAPLRETAIRAARIGGEILRRSLGDTPPAVYRKGLRDFVTSVDRESQAAIVDFLRQNRPGDSILAEESAAPLQTGRNLWAIDPLDGTTNFIHGYPCFSVSVAVLTDGEPVAGAVLDPIRDELFDAELGRGARRNGTRIRVSRITELQQALLVTGFPFRNPDQLPEFLEDFTALFRASSDIRRDGSAALDLCHVACGRLDGFWERGLSLWDIAAGCLFIREAGGIVTDLRGGATHLFGGDILAANPAIHRLMLAILERNTHRRVGEEVGKEGR